MMLTVDSPMNQAGYVHAYGLKNGVEYAGFVKLTSASVPVSQGQSYSQVVAPQQYDQQYQAAEPVLSGQQLAAPADKYLTLSIAPDGSASLDGERVMPSNPRTASVLRLLAKKSLPQINLMPASDSRVDSEISRVKSLLSRLEAEKQTRSGGARRAQSNMLAMAGSDVVSGRHRRGDESRRAMYADMKSLMRSVSKIERKENRMEKVVDKVSQLACRTRLVCGREGRERGAMQTCAKPLREESFLN
jgi:hypothetical protein